MTSSVIEIISLSWLSNLIVAFYVNRATEKKLPYRKPFSCEKCLGFWTGIIYFSIQMQPIEQIIIFASFTSLSAVTLRGVINRLNAI